MNINRKTFYTYVWIHQELHVMGGTFWLSLHNRLLDSTTLFWTHVAVFKCFELRRKSRGLLDKVDVGVNVDVDVDEGRPEVGSSSWGQRRPLCAKVARRRLQKCKSCTASTLLHGKGAINANVALHLLYFTQIALIVLHLLYCTIHVIFPNGKSCTASVFNIAIFAKMHNIALH